MSAIVHRAIADPDRNNGSNEALTQGQPVKATTHKNYKGFVAGVFSGVSKLAGMDHCRYLSKELLADTLSSGPPVCFGSPLALSQDQKLTNPSFDTIKVRLQTTEKSQFRGPIHCVLQTIQREGVKGLYKGATPPLVGWMFMDSVYAFHTPHLPPYLTQSLLSGCSAP